MAPEPPEPPGPPAEEKIEIKINPGIDAARATDHGFESGDCIGLYVVNYNGTAPGTLASAGIATKTPRGAGRSITARQDGPATYSAIVVPQRLENRVPLIEVVMNGVSFLYESKFLFKPGIHHIVNLVVDKNPEQVKIEIGGEITDWN